MKKFLLLLLGLIALGVVIANLGPMILLAVSLVLLYMVFRQFMKSRSAAGKTGWVILGLIILGITVSHVYALIGVVAAYFLFVIFRKWKREKPERMDKPNGSDPFNNFERQWAEMNK
jgi:lia operon protein LiaI